MEFTVTEFTPWSGLAGGALIGLSSGLMLALAGKVAGISGIAAGLMNRSASGVAWRALFVVGLIGSALVYPWLVGEPVPVNIQAGLPVMAAGGFLVGFGTRMGSGCTAGHGISGLARFSPRSLAATATFFATAIATVLVVRHVIGG
jgi:uncharacterized membrane protein YedE/YeeE